MNEKGYTTTDDLEVPDDDKIDYSLSFEYAGFDLRQKYPEFGLEDLRKAYRAGWEDSAAEFNNFYF